MGKKKVINQTLSKALKIFNEFKDLGKSCPDINTIEQLLKDSSGDVNHVREIIKVLIGEQESISTTNCHSIKTSEVSSTAGTSLRNCDYDDRISLRHDHIPHADQFNAFVEIMADVLPLEQIYEIWMIACACDHQPKALSYKDSIIADDHIIFDAVKITFENMSEESMMLDCLASDDSSSIIHDVDDRSVQDVVRCCLYERFEAMEDDELQIIIDTTLIDYDYDIEAASMKLCDYLSSKHISAIAFDFPSLQDAAIINQLVGSSYHMTSSSSYKAAIISRPPSSYATAVTSSTSSHPIQHQDDEIKACHKPTIIIAPLKSSSSTRTTDSYLKEYASWRKLANAERVMMMRRFADAYVGYNKQHSLSGYISDCGRIHQHNILKAHLNAAICALHAFNPHLLFDLNKTINIVTFHGYRSAMHMASSASQQELLTIDLHQLTVVEGIQVINAVSEWVRSGRYGRSHDTCHVRLIVGQGRHSESGAPTLGPALMKYLISQRYSCTYHDGVINTKLAS